MNTMGKRIARLREEKGWGQAELGRVMAEKIGRSKPYTRQLISRYEDDAVEPPAEARRALALALGREEAYILYGDVKKTKAQRTDADIFFERYLALSATDRQIVDLMLKKSGR